MLHKLTRDSTLSMDSILTEPIVQKIPHNRKILREQLRDIKVNDSYKNILITDNDEAIIYVLQNALAKKYNIYYALNGKEALEKLKVIERPNLIISEILMEQMDGFQFKNELSKNREYNSIPFIFLTLKQDMILESFKAGVIDYICKPFSLEILKAKISSILLMIDNYVSQYHVDFEHFRHKNKHYMASSTKLDEYNLTKTEKRIVTLALLGKMNKEIAYELKIAEGTVKIHLNRIYKKMRVSNRIDLIKKIIKYV